MREYAETTAPPADLLFHGDAELAPGLVDLAVNVRTGPRPEWLTAAIVAALDDLARYPDAGPARAAVAARHGRPADEVLLTAGAAGAFTLLARALSPRRPVLVHPQFTEPEAALRAAGHPVERVLLGEADGYRLDPARVPPDADLVVLGNPTNPTSVLHPPQTVAALARPGRVLVVDEAFADTVPGEPASLSRRRDLPGLVVVRSFTKTWGLAGLRIGYALGPADLLATLATNGPPWTVSTPALAAAAACATPVAVAAEREIATRLAAEREYLVQRLSTLDGVTVLGRPSSSFVLIRVPDGPAVHSGLRRRGYAVRRGATFPGLSPDHLRLAVRDTATSDAFAGALAAVLAWEA
jgi:histidinol-phosphate aminotransferase